VDDELHCFVVESANTASTSSINKKLQRMAYDAYYDDHRLYTTATGLKKIRPRKKQKTIDQLLLPVQAMGDGKLQHLLNRDLPPGASGRHHPASFAPPELIPLDYILSL
jgi:hypothetical protein